MQIYILKTHEPIRFYILPFLKIFLHFNTKNTKILET